MQPVVTDGAAWSVSLSVCHSCEPCKNSWTNWNANWVEDSGGQRSHVLDGVQIPHAKGQFWGGKGQPIVMYRYSAMSCAKKVEQIKMLFGKLSGMGPMKHVFEGGPDPPCRMTILRGRGAAHCIVVGPSAVSCAKTSEPIEMTFGVWSWVGPRKQAS